MNIVYRSTKKNGPKYKNNLVFGEFVWRMLLFWSVLKYLHKKLCSGTLIYVIWSMVENF